MEFILTALTRRDLFNERLHRPAVGVSAERCTRWPRWVDTESSTGRRRCERPSRAAVSHSTYAQRARAPSPHPARVVEPGSDLSLLLSGCMLTTSEESRRAPSPRALPCRGTCMPCTTGVLFVACRPSGRFVRCTCSAPGQKSRVKGRC
eukprot:5924969-Prymnesium_polylepis.1